MVQESDRPPEKPGSYRFPDAVGLFGGRGVLRFMYEPRTIPISWWYEHMSSTREAGIGFHTAFAVIGASRERRHVNLVRSRVVRDENAGLEVATSGLCRDLSREQPQIAAHFSCECDVVSVTYEGRQIVAEVTWDGRPWRDRERRKLWRSYRRERGLVA